MPKIKVAFFVFLLVSVVDLVGIIFKIPSLVFIFKPLILLSLLVLYSVSVSKRNKFYVLALIFSFFGDVFLLFSGELYFIVGLGSFLIAHILFIKIVLNRIQKSTVLNIIKSIIPFFILLVVLLSFLYSSLNELLIPVIIYGITITTFGVVAMLDYLNTKSMKSLIMLVGAIVFIASDSILAINKFYQPNEFLAISVMVTYIVAQYFIYRSMILDNK